MLIRGVDMCGQEPSGSHLITIKHILMPGVKGPQLENISRRGGIISTSGEGCLSSCDVVVSAS